MDPSWRPGVPCRVGDNVSDIDTPALVIDLDVMDENRLALKRIMKEYPNVSVRPHAKAHKCPMIARIQVEDGAVGVCAQTLTEAEAMVYGGGCFDVFVSNQVIGKKKLRRFAELGKYARISLCVDDIDNVRDINNIAAEWDILIGCVVEVNVGQNRCGVEPGPDVVALAQAIIKLPNVQFQGIQCYQGLNQHIRKAGDRKKAVELVVDKTKVALEALSSAGISCDYVTGGGTGSFPYEAASGLFTEVQPGSYLVMDADYARNFSEDERPFHEFKHSLFVLTTVQSRQGPVRAVLDAGLKAVSLDSGVPTLLGHEHLTFHNGGDEHGIITPAGDLKIGDRVKLIPGHCDPTVNLYDWIVGVRGDKVECIWPVLGRGPGI